MKNMWNIELLHKGKWEWVVAFCEKRDAEIRLITMQELQPKQQLRLKRVKSNET